MLILGHKNWAVAGALDPLLILALALALDALAGDMRLLFRLVPHPVVLAGRAIALFDRRLNRQTRSGPDRRARGVVTMLLLCAAAAGIGILLTMITLSTRLGWMLELFVVAVLLAQRSLFDHVLAVVRALEGGSLQAARDAVSHIVGRDPQSLDEYGVARAAVESLAENFSDGVAAPVFWYVVGGLPGLLVYKTVNTADSMIGYKTPRHIDFGWAAARLDDVLNLVPARLAGALVAGAALFVPGTHPVKALRIMGRDAKKHRSPNSGWPEAAMAGALDIALAGPRRYAELVVTDPWLGDGTARVKSVDMRRALMVFGVACLIQAGIVLLLFVAFKA
jgi:adenosylcobinamide-phosphate synthase